MIYGRPAVDSGRIVADAVLSATWSPTREIRAVHGFGPDRTNEVVL